MLQNVKSARTICAVFVGVLAISAACTTAGHTRTSSSVSATSTAANSKGTRQTHRSSTTLTCDDELGGEGVGGDSTTLGLDSDGWGGYSAKDFRRMPHKGKYTFFKTYTWVTKHAAKKTTLHVLKPASAKLYYTDGDT